MKCAFYLITVFIAIVGWFVLSELYSHGYITPNAFAADASIELSLFFPFIVFSYLLAKGEKLKNIVKDLGLSRKKLTAKNLLIGVLLFGLILLIEFLIGLFTTVTGIQLPTNVSTVLAGMPIYFLVFTFLIAPIDEEILFRGFLVPKLTAMADNLFFAATHRESRAISEGIGITSSALLFALPHLLTYASWSEFAAAFAFGIIAGYFFNRYKSLYTTISAHMLVNFLTIASMSLL